MKIVHSCDRKKSIHTVCNKDDGNFLKFQVKVTVQRITI